jgi:hypothetical protein
LLRIPQEAAEATNALRGCYEYLTRLLDARQTLSSVSSTSML